MPAFAILRGITMREKFRRRVVGLGSCAALALVANVVPAQPSGATAPAVTAPPASASPPPAPGSPTTSGVAGEIVGAPEPLGASAPPPAPPGPPPPPALPPQLPAAPPPPPYGMPAGLPECRPRGTPSPCVNPVDAYRHDGLYFRLAGGFDFLSFNGSGPNGDAHVSGATAGSLLAIGGTPGDGFVIAGALRLAEVRNRFHGAPTSPENNATAGELQLGVLADWYPNPTDGWHVGGLAGLGVLALRESQVRDASGAAFAASLFGGYDFWIGPQWSLGIMALFSATSSASLNDSDRNSVGYKFNALSAGVAYSFTLH